MASNTAQEANKLIVVRGDLGPGVFWAAPVKTEGTDISFGSDNPTEAGTLPNEASMGALLTQHRQELAEMLDLQHRMVSSLASLTVAAKYSHATCHDDPHSRRRSHSSTNSSPDADDTLAVVSPLAVVPTVYENGGATCDVECLDELALDKRAIEISLEQRERDESGTKSANSKNKKQLHMIQPTPLDHVFAFLPASPFFAVLRRWIERCLAVAEPERSGRLAWFLTHSRFEMASLSVIIANALFSAYVADYEIRYLYSEELEMPESGDPFSIPTAKWMRALELFFISFYSLELGAKLTMHGAHFFWNEEYGWNNFDFLLVILALYEQVVTLAGGTGGNVSFMRIFRLMKLTKVARLFRVLKFFRELRLMLYSMKASFVSLTWALIMLLFIFYVISLVILQGFTNLLLLQETSDATHDRVLEHFDSLLGTLVALYKSCTGGEDWGMYYAVVSEAGWAYGLLFLLFIAFFTFSVMNILTGIIVENVVSMAKNDEETKLLEYRTRSHGEVRELRSLFNCLDVNHDGFIGHDEWAAGMQTEKIQALMASMDLDINDASVFFEQLLAIAAIHDCGQEVDLGTFVDGCLKMRGTASSIDMQLLAFQGRVIQQTLTDLSRHLGSAAAPEPTKPLLRSRKPFQ